MKSYSVRPFSGTTLLDHLLDCRGISGEQEREQFLYPSYDNGLNDPFLLSDMEKAVKRISGAIEKNEKIVIFSDYDADGIPGAVVLSDYFKMIGYENVGVYIPHRHSEGFGLNPEAIDSIACNGAKLLITIDCGITDVEEVALANELGLEVVITDHHLPGPELPAALAIVNPKTSPEYPDQMLCGSGTVFKLVQGMLAHHRRGVPEGKEKWLLDMVGLATLSDMVPLRGENRVFAYYGMKVLRKSPRVGLRKLLSVLKISQQDLTEDDVAFMITPRINVASRMGHPMDAFRLLSTTDPEEAAELADMLNSLNSERKGVVGAITKEIQNKIDSRNLKDKKVIVLGNPSWKPAVLGLVANALMKEHRKPVFLWGRAEDDTLKGSCRSEGVADVVALMHHVPDGIFLDRGGHKMSGGFSVLTEHVHMLDEMLNKAFETLYENAEVSPVEYIADHILDINDVEWRVWDTIDKLAPFGMDNPKPVFLFKNVVPTSIKRFGKLMEHLEVVFKKSNGKSVAAISFFVDENDKHVAGLAIGTPINLAATLERSMFKRYPELRLRIVDVC